MEEFMIYERRFFDYLQKNKKNKDIPYYGMSLFFLLFYK